MRGRINSRKSYVPPLSTDASCKQRGCREVVASKSIHVGKDNAVVGSRGWQDYSIAGEKGGRTIDPDVAPVSAAFGVLCMPGPGAWFGLRDSGQPHRAPS